MSDQPIEGLKVPELKEELEKVGASTEGTKEELQQRLLGAKEAAPGTRGVRGDVPQYVAPHTKADLEKDSSDSK